MVPPITELYHLASGPARWPDELAESQVSSSLSLLQASAISLPQHEVPREILTFGDLLSQSLIAESLIVEKQSCLSYSISSPQWGGYLPWCCILGWRQLFSQPRLVTGFLVTAFVVGGPGAE